MWEQSQPSWRRLLTPPQGLSPLPFPASSGHCELAAGGRDNLVARNIAAIPLLPSSVHLGNISLNTHLTARPREIDASSASEGSMPATLKCHNDTPGALTAPPGAEGVMGASGGCCGANPHPSPLGLPGGPCGCPEGFESTQHRFVPSPAIRCPHLCQLSHSSGTSHCQSHIDPIPSHSCEPSLSHPHPHFIPCHFQPCPHPNPHPHFMPILIPISLPSIPIPSLRAGRSSGVLELRSQKGPSVLPWKG